MRGTKLSGGVWLAVGIGWFVGCGAEPLPEPEQELSALSRGLTSTSFQDGVSPSSSYVGTRDAAIEEDSPRANHGTDTSLSASGDTPSGSGHESYVLLKWDVSAIPANAVIRSASITVAVSDKADQGYDFYALTRSWTEGQVTWKKADASQAWTSNGADGAGDRGATSLGVLRAASTGSYTVTLNTSGLEVVRQWVASPSSNHGVLLANKDNDNRLEFRSREYSTRTSRPKLTVTWDPAGSGPAAGTYAGTCDGSGGVWLDSAYFLNLNDESQSARVYAQGTSAAAVQSKDLGSALGLSSAEEADFEDAARVGNRVYGVTSHARNKDGKLEASRYRFFALDLSGAAPSLSMQVAGSSSSLLKDMLVASNWATPDASVLSLLQARSRLSEGTVPELAPKLNGLNIEGLAALPSGGLVLGLRNPRSGSNAILVSLTNPDAVVAGATARFGQAFLLNLGGQAVRGMAWSPFHQAVLLIGGPSDESDGPFSLWKWKGDGASAPVKVMDLSVPADSGPEALIPTPDGPAVRVLIDMGARPINGTPCKDLSPASQSFNDLIVQVN